MLNFYKYKIFLMIMLQILGILSSNAQSGHIGYIDTMGKILVPFNDSIRIGRIIEGHLIVSTYSDKYKIYDRLGKVTVLPTEYSIDLNYGSIMNGTIEVYNRKVEKLGLIDMYGNITIPFKYQGVQNFSEGLAAVQDNYKWGFINKQGDIVINFIYDKVKPFNSGISSVTKDGNTYFIDKNNRIIFEKYFKDGVGFWGKVGIVQDTSNKWALIDSLGEILTPFKYTEIYYNQNETFSCRIDNKWGIVDTKGKELTPIIYDLTIEFDDNLECAYVNIGGYGGKYGLIDKLGNKLTEVEFTDIDKWLFNKNESNKYAYRKFVSEDMIGVFRNHKGGYLDKLGRTIIDNKYDNITFFSEGLAGVKLGNYWGYIDNKGKVIIPFKYDKIAPFKEGLATVQLNYKYGFIDKSGKEIIPLIYDYAYSFTKNLTLVKMNGVSMLIDKKGKKICNLDTDGLSGFIGGFAEIFKN
jgi:WG containing repeat